MPVAVLSELIIYYRAKPADKLHFHRPCYSTNTWNDGPVTGQHVATSNRSSWLTVWLSVGKWRKLHFRRAICFCDCCLIRKDRAANIARHSLAPSLWIYSAEWIEFSQKLEKNIFLLLCYQQNKFHSRQNHFELYVKSYILIKCCNFSSIQFSKPKEPNMWFISFSAEPCFKG